ncbi:MAG: right-handed parallel beta-helix repeat-containing protein [Rhodobacteraceae bacterium]|nr:right-handed parallel beta-helix repeat-containing protein [Paracoccaceae bacterium]
MFKPRIRRLILTAALTLAALPAAARDHWVSAAAASGDGSAERPWPSVAAALGSDTVRGGDRVLLQPGSYGDLTLTNRHFSPALTLMSAPGGRAHAERVVIKNSSGLILRDLNVWPRQDDPRKKGILVQAMEDTSGIVFDALDIRGAHDAANYLSWDARTWLDERRVGVRLGGRDGVLRGSVLTGVGGGVLLPGPGSKALGNEIRGFSKDGMRVFGSNAEIRGNVIRDCVKVDGNHDDGIQSWVGKNNPDGAITGVVIDGNRIIEWTGPQDHPLRCTLQGIGLFTGPFRNWVIQNNLIAARAHHGISMYDMHGARVVNNTVVNLFGKVGTSPWIQQDKSSRDGSNIIANNVAMQLRIGNKGRPLRNFKVGSMHDLFENPAVFDYRPRAGSALIDAADPAFAPPHDIDGIPRPKGRAPDLGAYERP